MKKNILLLVLMVAVTQISVAQVAINATGANPATGAGLDVDFTNRGLLIPRVALSSTVSNSPIGAGLTTSVMVYNTATVSDVSPGYYYWNGTNWVRFLVGKEAWMITGNDNTTAPTTAVDAIINNNFIGTTTATDLAFATNGYERMRIKTVANGSGIRIGIGTNSATSYPSSSTTTTLLHVYDGGTTANDFAQVQLGANKTTATNKVGEINFHSSLDATDRRTACIESFVTAVSGSNPSGDIRFSTNNLGTFTEKMRLFATGQLSIGSTVAGGKLDVHQEASNDVGRFTTYGSTNDIRLRRTQGTLAAPTATSGAGTILGRIFAEGYNGANFTAAAAIELTTDAAGGTSTDMPGRIVFSTTPDGSGTLAERVRITNTGYVGIGTTVPAYNLDITGNTRTTGKYFGHLNVDDTRAVNEPPTAYNNEVAFDFKTRSTVGVGGSGTYSGQLTIAPWGDNSGDASHQINFNEGGLFWRQGQPDAATWDPWVQILTSNIAPIGSGTLNYVVKWTPNGSTLGNSQIFDNGTNVGIGTTSPTSLFNIVGAHSTTQMRLTLPAAANGGGTGEVNLQLWASEPGITWDAGGIGTNVTNNNGAPAGFGRINASLGQAYIRFITNGGAMAFNTTNNAGTYYQTMYMTNGNVGIGTTTPTYKLHVIGRFKSDGINETSDIRLKKNIQPIADALAKVMQLQGVTYEWNKEGMEEGLNIGLIAQEVEKILPEVVDTDNEGYKSVQYSVLVALLIEAIKEQQVENKTLSDKVSLMELDMVKIKAMLNIEIPSASK